MFTFRSAGTLFGVCAGLGLLGSLMNLGGSPEWLVSQIMRASYVALGLAAVAGTIATWKMMHPKPDSSS